MLPTITPPPDTAVSGGAFYLLLCPGILSRIGLALGLVIGNVLNAEVLQHLEQGLAAVGKGHGTVVGIALLDQHMAVEAAHLPDGEDADAAKGTGGNGQDLAFRDVGAQVALGITFFTSTMARAMGKPSRDTVIMPSFTSGMFIVISPSREPLTGRE